MSYDSRFAPGGFATIFGNNLLPSPTVLVGGKQAYVAFAASSQLNIELPVDASIGASSVTVNTTNGTSTPFNITVDAYAPGFFTVNGSGTGPGQFLNGSFQPISQSTPAHPDQTIIAYMIGLGATNPIVPTGTTSPSQPPAQTTQMPTLTVGGQPATVLFSGLAPGQIAIYQVNFIVPDAPRGNDAVVLTIGEKASNQVTIYVGSQGADFNGDGIPDVIIQNDTSRQVAIYYMGGAGGAAIIGFGWIREDGIPGWSVKGAADFNGDGIPDVIIQNDTTRQVAIYYMGGTGGAAITGFAWIRSDGIPGWSVVGAVDLNRDGVPDVIIQNDTTRQIAVYYMGGAGGTTITGFSWIRADGIPGWSVKGTGDLNGDGVPDVIIQNDTTRQVAVYYMGGGDGSTIMGFAWIRSDGIPGWSVVGAADLNGDGVPDVIIQNDSTRQVAVYYMGGGGGATIMGFAWIRSDGIPGWRALAP